MNETNIDTIILFDKGDWNIERERFSHDKRDGAQTAYSFNRILRFVRKLHHAGHCTVQKFVEQ